MEEEKGEGTGTISRVVLEGESFLDRIFNPRNFSSNDAFIKTRQEEKTASTKSPTAEEGPTTRDTLGPTRRERAKMGCTEGLAQPNLG